MGFPINFPHHEKMQQNPSYEENLENWYSYLGAFSPFMVYLIICEIHGFPHKFPISWEHGVKSIESEEPGKRTWMFFYFNPIKDEPFWGCSRMGVSKSPLLPKICYDVIIFVHDINNKILSRNPNYIVDVVMWLY